MRIVEHAHHFLTRLDRLSLPHVELALSLYRDHQLVKVVLDVAKVPEGVERIALSLADPKQGPFLVVTRDGKFVTCLGEGMSKGDLLVISREKLDGVATRVEVLRGRIELAQKTTGARGGAGKFFQKIYEAGPRLSREDFLVAAAWQPMLVTDYLHWMINTANDVNAARVILLRQLRRTDKFTAKFDESIRHYSNSVWFIGHMAALAALDGKLPFEELPEKAFKAMHQLPFAWCAVRQGLMGPALRGIWGAARMGKMLLQTYKKLYGEATTFYRTVESTFSLAAIGLRHSRVAAEVEKTFTSPLPRCGADEHYQKALDLTAQIVALTYKTARVERDFMASTHLKMGRSIAMKVSAGLKPGSRFKYAQAEEVPDDIARALPFNTSNEFAGEWKNVQIMSFLLPWLVTAEAEQFYLPAEYFSEAQITYEPEEIMPLLLGIRDAEYRSPGDTRTTPKGADRNSACPCGSGRKYKRCCIDKKTSAD